MAFTPFTEQDMPTMENFNSKFQSAIDDAVQKAVASGVKIQTGSYTGTGTYGQSNPCSLTFDFEPKVVFLQTHPADTYNIYNIVNATLVFGSNATATVYGNYDSGGTGPANSGKLNLSFGGNTVSWYSVNSDNHQLNLAGNVCRYTAIG